MNLTRFLISKYLDYASRSLHRKCRSKRSIENFYLYYRICDHGYPKEKPSYITKENCLKNAVQQFPLERVNWTVYADNICDETYNMIRKYIPEEQIRRVNVGHGAGTFRMVYDEAIKKNSNDFVYFLEDDYLHLPNSYNVLVAAAECNYQDYFTLYDHPDKYGYNSPNPFVINAGEKTEVYWCKIHHWKRTNSTTMTFAAFVDVLRKDKKIFWRWTESKHPFDFEIFTDMRLNNKRGLVCAIPSMSTHGEVANLAYGVEWDNVL